jgi:ketosteroid isomerase-like protein
MTPAGAVPASGNRVRLNVIEVHQWRDGKLSRVVNYQDSMALLAQMGALPAPTGL